MIDASSQRFASKMKPGGCFPALGYGAAVFSHADRGYLIFGAAPTPSH
jgi:hypothetical protein